MTCEGVGMAQLPCPGYTGSIEVQRISIDVNSCQNRLGVFEALIKNQRIEREKETLCDIPSPRLTIVTMLQARWPFGWTCDGRVQRWL